MMMNMCGKIAEQLSSTHQAHTVISKNQTAIQATLSNIAFSLNATAGAVKSHNEHIGNAMGLQHKA